MMAGGGGQVYSLFPSFILDSLIAPLLELFKQGKYATILICFKRGMSVDSLEITWLGSTAYPMNRCLLVSVSKLMS